MNELKTFTNAEFGSVRTIEIDNEPYFVGKDLTDILKYQNGSRDINSLLCGVYRGTFPF